MAQIQSEQNKMSENKKKNRKQKKKVQSGLWKKKKEKMAVATSLVYLHSPLSGFDYWWIQIIGETDRRCADFSPCSLFLFCAGERCRVSDIPRSISPSLLLSVALSCSLSLSHTQPHTHSLSLSHTHTHTHTRSHTLTLCQWSDKAPQLSSAYSNSCMFWVNQNR